VLFIDEASANPENQAESGWFLVFAVMPLMAWLLHTDWLSGLSFEQ